MVNFIKQLIDTYNKGLLYDDLKIDCELMESFLEDYKKLTSEMQEEIKNLNKKRK